MTWDQVVRWNRSRAGEFADSLLFARLPGSYTSCHVAPPGCEVVMLKYSVVSEPQPFSPTPPTESGRNAPVDPGSHERMREAGRSIGDRVRRVLVPEGSPIATLRFLVVDDHLDSADSLAAVLEMLGWPVRTCYDPASAIQLAGQFDPQVCLLDLKMPGMDGFQLAGHLKAHAAGGPLLLIATTALADEESRRKSQAAGFHCHLVKPIDMPTLIDAVMRLWDLVREQGGDLPRGQSGPDTRSPRP